MTSGKGFLSTLLNIAGQVINAVLQSRSSNPSATKQTGSNSSTQKPRSTPRAKIKKPTASQSGQAAVKKTTATKTSTKTVTPAAGRKPAGSDDAASPGQFGATATVDIDPPAKLTMSYAPSKDGDPDAGEVIWTWVPYEENDGRGKDRPVLVIGRATGGRVYAVRLTSKAHDGQRDFLSIGTGAWDPQGRPSWIDIDQLYLVHPDGMRREAAVLDQQRFHFVAEALKARYGWTIGR